MSETKLVARDGLNTVVVDVVAVKGARGIIFSDDIEG